jgi:hypothetical protein
MKRYNILFVVLLSIIGFTSCEDKIGTTINSKAVDGSLSFKLNQTQYANSTYVLENANADANMDSLTCVQPAYGFTAAVTYTTQVCFDSNFAAGTFQSLPTTINGEKVNVNVKEMDKAIIALYGGSLPTPVVVKNVYVRLKAVISDATSTPLDTIQTVKPLYSNSIMLKILPYVLPLFPYTEVTPRLWYMVGLGGNWDNSNAGLGSSLIPLSLSDGKKYNLNGDGEFIYTGYFKASDGFKLLRNIGDWNNDVWGMTGSSYVHNGGGNISVPADGYYRITLNSIDNKLTIAPITISPAPATYASIGLIGAFNGWGGDVALAANTGSSKHVWYTTYTFAADSQCKLRANGAWDSNWGIPGSTDGNPLYSAMGISVMGGKNMIETAGTYTIILNDIDGCYFFIKK